jgi:DNA invertase Pin-like site-specific DNA recombinase
MSTSPSRTKRAVLYLRVSSPAQVNTDYNPEGISIPAQREACERKAEALDAQIVGEYVEPGRTATSIEKRPVFQEMLARIKTDKDVDYVIVYHFSRIFRNAVDAAITKRDLSKVGARIISTVLHLDDSPESQMVETIMHAVDQYQSQASGADVRYKMSQKAKSGGTISQAKLGYLNVRDHIDGREVRSIAVDPERGPLITKLFELYATGQYSGKQVQAQITTAGLRTRKTKRHPGGPISMTQLYRILSEPYYLGRIEYQGQEYPGRHQPLTSQDTFDRVQRVIALHGGGGTRDRKYQHYLKGLLWCARCGHRLVLARAKGNGGEYFYFFCRGHQRHVCDLPYLPVDRVERAVERHYARVRLSDDFRQRLKQQLDDLLKSESNALAALGKRLGARLEELATREDQYLDLLGTPGWPNEKIKQKLNQIETERAAIAKQLDGTGSQLESGRQLVLLVLDLLSDPQEFYRRGGTKLKRAMNKIVFERLYVDKDAIEAHSLAPAVAGLVRTRPQPAVYERRNDPLASAGCSPGTKKAPSVWTGPS